MKIYKSIDELINDGDKFILSIPNQLGINLCSVKGIEYNIQENGQLKSLKIIFNPDNSNK